jgi:hypothetical protein
MYIANTFCINNRIIIKLLLKILWQTNDYKPNKQINNYQIENILNKYFTETKLKEQGLPTVKF